MLWACAAGTSTERPATAAAATRRACARGPRGANSCALAPSIADGWHPVVIGCARGYGHGMRKRGIALVAAWTLVFAASAHAETLTVSATDASKTTAHRWWQARSTSWSSAARTPRRRRSSRTPTTRCTASTATSAPATSSGAAGVALRAVQHRQRQLQRVLRHRWRRHPAVRRRTATSRPSPRREAARSISCSAGPTPEEYAGTLTVELTEVAGSPPPPPPPPPAGAGEPTSTELFSDPQKHCWAVSTGFQGHAPSPLRAHAFQAVRHAVQDLSTHAELDEARARPDDVLRRAAIIHRREDVARSQHPLADAQPHGRGRTTHANGVKIKDLITGIFPENARKALQICDVYSIEDAKDDKGDGEDSNSSVYTCAAVVAVILQSAENIANRDPQKPSPIRAHAAAANSCNHIAVRLKSKNKRPRLRVSCTRTRLGIKLTIRSGTRGKSLKSVLGSRPRPDRRPPADRAGAAGRRSRERPLDARALERPRRGRLVGRGHRAGRRGSRTSKRVPRRMRSPWALSTDTVAAVRARPPGRSTARGRTSRRGRPRRGRSARRPSRAVRRARPGRRRSTVERDSSPSPRDRARRACPAACARPRSRSG